MRWLGMSPTVGLMLQPVLTSYTSVSAIDAETNKPMVLFSSVLVFSPVCRPPVI